MTTIYAGEKVIAENVDFETFLHGFGDRRVEYDDGRVIEMAAATGRHNEIVGFLYVLLGVYLQRTGEGKVRQETFTMRMIVDEKIRGPEPDLLVVTTPNLHRLTETYLDGPADLVIEVVSPESDLRDRVTKLAMYQRAGVREYWIVDPVFEEILFYVLDENGEYHRQAIDEDGFYRSAVLPRLYFNPSLFLQNPVPDLDVAFQTVGEMLKEGR